MTIAAQSRPRCVLVSPAAVWVSRSGQIRGARWSVDDDSYESDFVVPDNVIEWELGRIADGTAPRRADEASLGLDMMELRTEVPRADTVVFVEDVGGNINLKLLVCTTFGVAGAAGDHYKLLIFGLILSIALMAFAATLISNWIKKYKWIAWAGLLAILIVAIELIYTDIKILFL